MKTPLKMSLKMPLIAVLLCLALSATAQSDNQLQTLVVQLQKQFDESRLEIQQLRADHVQETQQLQERLAKVEAASATTADLEVRVRTLESSVSIVEQQVLSMDAKITLTQSQIVSILSDVTEVEEDTREVGIRMDKVESIVENKVERRLDAVELQVGLQKEKDTDHSKLLDKLETGLEELEDTTDSRLDAYDKQMTTIDTTLQQMQGEAQSVESRVKQVEIADERYSFLATLTSHHVGNGVIKFNHAIHNRGKAYDPTTGVFTAPKNGIYEFTVNLLIVDTSGQIFLEILVDDVAVTFSHSMQIHCLDAFNYPQTVQLELKKDQRVTVKTMDVNHIFGDSTPKMESYFTGHMVQV